MTPTRQLQPPLLLTERHRLTTTSIAVESTKQSTSSTTSTTSTTISTVETTSCYGYGYGCGSNIERPDIWYTIKSIETSSDAAQLVTNYFKGYHTSKACEAEGLIGNLGPNLDGKSGDPQEYVCRFGDASLSEQLKCKGNQNSCSEEDRLADEKLARETCGGIDFDSNEPILPIAQCSKEQVSIRSDVLLFKGLKHAHQIQCTTHASTLHTQP